MSACPHQASEQPITNRDSQGHDQSPILQVAFGSLSFTTFLSGSLTLTILLSLAPHPGATPEITPDPSRDLTYPVRWLLCQSAQHLAVTSDAPLLDYKGLNPWLCRSADLDAQSNYLYGFRRMPLLAFDRLRFCTRPRNEDEHAMRSIDVCSGCSSPSRLVSHAWEARVLPLYDARSGSFERPGCNART